MAVLTIDSPFGPMRLTSRNGALVALSWGAGSDDDADPVVMEGARQLSAYFAGRLRVFDLPLAPDGTAFRRRVWDAMSAIPYGRVATYGDLARAVGTAPRAVGGACGANPLPIIVPCHRVVGCLEKPGGYSGQGGLATKSWLLDHERRQS